MSVDYLAFKQTYKNDLLHYGIKRRSGRYPWGSGENPYQSEGGKKQEESRRFKNDEEKAKILRTGSATDIIKYQDELTTQELQNALNRIRIKRDLRNISREELSYGFTATDIAMKKVGKVKTWGKTWVDLYNIIEDILKILNS